MGIADSNAFIYGCSGFWNSSLLGTLSTHCPKYITAIARTELGFDKFDYHSLRHTHATMLAEKGASPKYVQYRLGHKNIQVTMQIYQHLTNKMSTENAQLLELF